MEKLKRKNIWKPFLTAFVLCCSIFLGTAAVHAEQTGSIPVTYTKDEDTTFTLHVDVSGPGQVETGTDILKNQKKDYQLAVTGMMSFNAKAYKNSKVKSVILNGEEIKLTSGQNIDVYGKKQEQTLKITFEPDGKSTKPKTGDETKIALFAVMAVGSVSVFLFIKHRRKERREANEAE